MTETLERPPEQAKRCGRCNIARPAYASGCKACAKAKAHRTVRPAHLDCEGGCGLSIEQDPNGTKLKRWCPPCRAARYVERYRKPPAVTTCRRCPATGQFGAARLCDLCKAQREAEELARPRRLRSDGPPSYGAIHLRLRKDRGRAATYSCANACGRQALEWSYNNEGKDEYCEIRNDKVYAYSTDLTQYDPLCKPCHNERDGCAWTRESYAASALKRANDMRAIDSAGPEISRISTW